LLKSSLTFLGEFCYRLILPAGKMEGFFKTTDAWTSPPTLKEIEKAFADHDMKVVGPPLKAEYEI